MSVVASRRDPSSPLSSSTKSKSQALHRLGLPPTHRCSLKFQDHLLELKMRQDLEYLRLPLTDLRVFPADKDPHTAPITMEELKKLVRAWKLHDVRGFWKAHQEKDDLVRVCLKHMEKTKYREIIHRVIQPERPTNPRIRRPETSSSVSSPTAGSGTTTPGRERRVLKPYMGDIFGHYQYDGGILYLSRFEQSKSHKKKLPKTAKPVLKLLAAAANTINNKLNGNFTDSDDEGGEVRSAHGTFETVAEQLYHFSLHKGPEADIVKEGAIKVISKLCKSGSRPVARCCAAAIHNLAADDLARPLLLKSSILECITSLLATHSGDPAVLQCCTFALSQLSSENGHEERIFRDFVTALPKLTNNDNRSRMVYVLTLSNLMESSVRPYVLVQLLNLYKTLDIVSVDLRSSAVNVAVTLTTYEDCRHALIDGCLTSLLVSFVSQNTTWLSRKDGPAEMTVLMRQVATALCNLSCHAEGRERMISDGAVRAAVLLAGAAVDHETRVMCLNAMLNLSGVCSQTHVFILNKAIGLLVDLSARVDDHASLLLIVDILQNLTCCTSGSVHLERMVQDGAHLALTRLMTKPTSRLEVRIVALRTLTTLLIEPTNFKAIVITAKALPIIVGLAQSAINTDPIVLSLVSTAIYNACLHPEMLDTTDETLVSFILVLVKHSDTTIRMNCLKSIMLLSRSPRLCYLLSAKGLLTTITTIITSPDKDTVYYCSVALASLASMAAEAHVSWGAPLLSKDVILECINQLVKSQFLGSRTLQKCAEAVSSLCQDLQSNRGVADIVRLAHALIQRSHEPDVVYLVGFIFFRISAKMETRAHIAQDGETLNLLIRMMRGAAAGTQLHSAKALCNMTCDHKCARLMMESKSVEDFVVITTLRATNLVIKEICVATLFNLLSHHDVRQDFIKAGILWAIVKISADCGPAQSLCSRAIFNLSFHTAARQEMVDMGVAKCLALISQQPLMVTKRQLIGVLYNLSFSHADALLQNRSSEVLHNPVMQALNELTANLDMDGSEDKYCTIILKNLSETSPSQQKVAVFEGATNMLLSLANSRDRYAARVAIMALFNFSTSRDCRGPMVDDQVLPGLVHLLQDSVRDLEPDFKMVGLVLACLKNFSMNAKLRRQLVQLHVMASCLAVVSKWTSALAQKRKATPTPMTLDVLDWEIGRSLLRLASNLSWQDDVQSVMLAEGIVETMLGAIACLGMDPGACVDLATAVCNLTSSAEGARQVATASCVTWLGQLLQAREAYLLAEEQSSSRNRMLPSGRRRSSLLSVRKSLAPVVFQRDFGVCEEDIALVIRNISYFKEAAIQMAHLPQTVPLLERLVKLRSPFQEVVVTHVAHAMLSFFRNEECERELNLQGASSVVLQIGRIDSLDVSISQVCALALSHQRHRLSSEYQAESMNALVSLMRLDKEPPQVESSPQIRRAPPEESLPADIIYRGMEDEDFCLPYCEAASWECLTYDMEDDLMAFNSEDLHDLAPTRVSTSPRTTTITYGSFKKVKLARDKYAYITPEVEAAATLPPRPAQPGEESEPNKRHSTEPITPLAKPRRPSLPSGMGGMRRRGLYDPQGTNRFEC